MIIVRIVQFVKIVQLVQLDYYGYIKFFGVFVGTWVGAFTFDVDTMIPLTWIDIATKIMSEINEQYRICLHYDENKKHWIYK